MGKKDAEDRKTRKLSEKEKKRLAAFEEVSGAMEEQGYRKTDLTIDVGAANVFSLILFIPVAITGVLLYLAVNGKIGVSVGPGTLGIFAAVMLLLVVVHELIHGISWAAAAGNGFRDIDFGIMWKYLAPYCSCSRPLNRKQYITGAAMPLIVLGIIPMAAGILTGSFWTLLMGIIMTDAAAGDIMIMWKILRYRSSAGEVVYMDHPTEGGGVIFER